MQLNSVLCLTLLGSSTAQTINAHSRYSRISPRDVVTLPTIKSALKHGTEGVKAVNTALAAVTASNVKEQLVVVNNALTKLGSEVLADTRKIKSSGSIGIGEILGLASEAPRNELLKTITDLFTALNGTFTELSNKRDIIKDSGAVDIIVPGIKAQRDGLVNIVAIVPSQVPSIAKGAINGIVNSMMTGGGKGKGGAPPGGASPAADAMARLIETAPMQEPKGKGGKGGKGGAPKGGAPKSGGGGKSSAPPAGGQNTLDSLLASQESIDAMNKGVDGALDQLISWLRGTTNDLIPPELLAGLPKGAPGGGMPKGAPKGGAPKGKGPAPAPAPAPAPDASAGGD